MPSDNLMPQNTTSKIKQFMLRSSSTGLGLTGKTSADFTGKYNINGGAEVTLSFSPGTAGDAYSSGKIVPLGLGKYAWHVPNVLFQTLGDVLGVLCVSGAIDEKFSWEVVADNRDLATKPVNVTQFGGTNLTAAAGIPEVKVASMADNTLTAAAISADAGAELAALVETYIVNEGDATAVMQAIADKIAQDWIAGDASPVAVANAVWSVATRTITGGSLTTSPPTAGQVADAVWDEVRSGHVTAGTFGEKVNAELDSGARVTLAASQPDYVPATAAALAAAKTILDKIDSGMVLDGSVYQFTANMLELAPSGGGGSSDWTDNERAVIRAILGIPASGTTPANPTTGILDGIRDLVVAYIAAALATVNGTSGTIVGFPATLNVGDSYTDDCNSSIHVFIRDENDDPITSVGTHDFTDGDFAPECTITQNGNTGRVKCEVEYVTASPENYLKIQIPSKESRRATPGIATVQVLLKWDGAQKVLSKQTVTWEALI